MCVSSATNLGSGIHCNNATTQPQNTVAICHLPLSALTISAFNFQLSTFPMKLFGFNISVSRLAAPQQSDGGPALQRSFSPESWLRGEDIDAPGSSLSNAYQQVVWVYRAINVLAEQVANIPFLFSAGDRGRESLITTGPLLDFYSHPAPGMNRFQYWEMRVIWLMLRGACFRVPIYADGPRHSALDTRHPERIVMLDPAQCHHIIEDNQLVGWRYTGFGRNAPLASQVFLPEEVWFEKLPNPFDVWRGMPPLYVAE